MTARGWNFKIAKAFAWEFENGDLGRWAEPTREAMKEQEPPSPGAKIVPVVLVKWKDWSQRNKGE